MESPLSSVLAEKSENLHVVAPQDTILHSVNKMNELNVGAVLVMETGQLQGIFTERDVLKKVITPELQPKTTLVEQVMTRKVITVTSEMRVAEAMSVMTQKRIRHLPVVDSNQVKGIISIGDLTRWVSNLQESTIRDLENYINGSW